MEHMRGKWAGLDEKGYELLRSHMVRVAEAGNFWWRNGYPAIAEKLMEANLMMLEETVESSHRDEFHHSALLAILTQIKRELASEQSSQRTH